MTSGVVWLVNGATRRLDRGHEPGGSSGHFGTPRAALRVTAAYTGEAERYRFNEIAGMPAVEGRVGRGAAKFDDPSRMLLTRLTPLECSDWFDKNRDRFLHQESFEGVDVAAVQYSELADRHKKTVRRALRAQQQELYSETAIGKTGQARLAKHQDELDMPHADPESPVDLQGAVSSTDEEEEDDGSVEMLSRIDPELLTEEQLMAVRVNEAKLSTASRLIRRPQDADFASLPEAFTDAALTSVAREESLSLGSGIRPEDSAMAYVNRHAAINVVKHKYFARMYPKFVSGETFESTAGLYSRHGHARDEPTPFLYACPGCGKEYARRDLYDAHLVDCNDERREAQAVVDRKKREATTHACEQCDFVANTKKALGNHVANVHKWTAKRCPHGCNENKEFTSGSAFASHMSHSHSARWPAKCHCKELNPCDQAKTYSQANTLHHHLLKFHGVEDVVDRLTFFPPVEKRVYSVQSCRASDGLCGQDKVFPNEVGLRRHLQQTHKYTLAQWTEYKTQTMTVTITQEGACSSSSATRQLAKNKRTRQGDEAEDRPKSRRP